jgi:uncharacterized protein (TIGR03437 family)
MMNRIRSFALNAWLLAVLLGLGPSPLRAASPHDDGHGGSGTYPGRILTELFLHHQQQLRLNAGERAALSAEIARSLRADIGNIAIIEDTNGVVIQANQFDLEGRSVTFAPSGGLYEAMPGPLALDAAARNFGVNVPLADDDAEAVLLPFAFPFFGGQYTEAWLHSDGNITFEEPDSGTSERSLSRAVSGPPRIAAFFSDLDPSRTGARVSVYSTSTRVVFTWDGVPRFGQFAGSRHVFQAALHDDGTIEFHYLDITSNEAVVGLMPGRLRGEPTASDLSQGARQTVLGALAEIFSPRTDLDIMAAAQRFYLNHDDAYDFLVVFNDFGLAPGPGTFAFEVNVRNEVLGIGDLLFNNPVIDFGNEFGSQRRLASFLNMGPLNSYPGDPTQKIPGLGENSTLSVMGQEAGHRFLAYVRFLDPASGTSSRALLGRDSAHWSFFFNSEASVVEGNRIEDRGPGVTPRFATVDAVSQYSPLDQYIMGVRAPEEVPPSFLVVNPSVSFSASRAPAVGVSFNGERKEIPIDLIINAEGPRIPDATVSQKHLRFAFVLLVREGAGPSALNLEKLERIRGQWEAFFEQAVDHRGTADTSLAKMLHLSTWPAAGVLAGVPGGGQVEISEVRETSLDVMLSAPSGLISVPAVVTIPAGSLAAPFTIIPNATGVTDLTASAAEPGFEQARTRVAVAGSAAALSLVVQAGGGQAGARGDLLPNPVVFRVKDGNLLPYSGVSLVFSANDDSVITPTMARTDAHGLVEVRWRLGSRDGSSTLTARLESSPGVNAAATASVAGERPSFSAASLVNAASYVSGLAGEQPSLSPGGLYSLFGLDLAAGVAAGQSPPLPVSLQGTIVRINGVPAPLVYVSPRQINFQAPFELSGPLAQITVETPAGLSEPVAAAIREVHPGIFFDTLTGVGAVLNVDNTPVSQNAARRGTAIQIFATGLGAVEPGGRTGAAAGSAPLSLTAGSPRVTIGGLQAEVSFSGLAPFLAGVYQVNATVPVGLAPGRHALRIDIEGISSNNVLIDVQ